MHQDSVKVCDEIVKKTFKEDSVFFENEVKWYNQLRDSDLTPKLLSVEGTTLTMERKGVDLYSHIRKNPNFDKIEMGKMACELICKLHKLGVAHRDVHTKNILVCKDRLYLIDFEFTTTSGVRSYDLYGPDRSGIPIPEMHLKNGILNGVWWDSELPKSPVLGMEIGPLEMFGYKESK